MFIDITEREAEREYIPRQPAPQQPFSLDEAVMLAGFAFDVYNEPSDVKWDIGKDGAKCAFLSEDFVREVYSGVLTITVLRAEGLPLEQNRLEALATGFLPDPYVTLRLDDRQSLATQPQRTSARPNTKEPVWNEMFMMYCTDPEHATLQLALHDSDRFKADDLYGASNVSISQVVRAGEEGWMGWVELRADDGSATNGDAGGKEAVRLQLDITYVPFEGNGNGYSDEDLINGRGNVTEKATAVVETVTGGVSAALAKAGVIERTGRNSSSPEGEGLAGPRGCLPGVDWRELTQHAGGIACTAGDFAPVCFLEHDDTDTQVAVWRDAKRKRIVVSFRGTQATRWRDVLTDANAVLEPLDRLIRNDSGLNQWELESISSQVEAVAEGLAKARDALPQRLKDAAALLPDVPDALSDISSNLDKLRGVLSSGIGASVTTPAKVIGAGGEMVGAAINATTDAGVSSVKELGAWMDTLQTSMGKLSAGVLGVAEDAENGSRAIGDKTKAGYNAAAGVYDSLATALQEARANAPEKLAAFQEALSNMTLKDVVSNVTVAAGQAAARTNAPEKLAAFQEALSNVTIKHVVSNVTAVAGQAAAAAQDAVVGSLTPGRMVAGGNGTIKVTSGAAASKPFEVDDNNSLRKVAEAVDQAATLTAAAAIDRANPPVGAKEMDEGEGDEPAAVALGGQKIPMEAATAAAEAANVAADAAEAAADKKAAATPQAKPAPAPAPALLSLPAPQALATVGEIVRTGDYQAALRGLSAVQSSLASILDADSLSGILENAGLASGSDEEDDAHVSGASEDKQGGFWQRLLRKRKREKEEKIHEISEGINDDDGERSEEDVEEQLGQVAKLQRELKRLVELSEAERVPKVHAGFRGAYASVRETLADVICVATGGSQENWQILLTGHSLGGALSTLATVDIRRRFPAATVSAYSFGAPRAGNTAFSELHNSLCGESFRLVNKRDLVARMPRSRVVSRILDYKHTGRLVLVDEDKLGSMWVESESTEPNPAKEYDPLTLLTGEQSSFFQAELELLSAMVSGEGLAHHLEDDYFTALRNVLQGPSLKAQTLAAAKVEEATAKWVWPA